ncbi:MAG: DUF839 domain-containing protein [Bacillaceae bacterium]|nr:DUF839 domain-containing protein [Bacillaceae bacterium]
MDNKQMNRRDFLRVSGISTIALTLGTTGLFSLSGQAKTIPQGRANNPTSGFGGYGPLVKDPNGILDLPQGFQYKIISQTGDKLSNGAPIPGAMDGMAAFQGKHNTTVLVRNHEQALDAKYPVYGSNPFNSMVAGGTTALVVGPDREVVKEYVTNSGTAVNCAGGPSTWGTWLTCEEVAYNDGVMEHGFVFEVDPTDPENQMSKTPIRDMGFFSHEACSVDPATGIWYLTEDARPISFLYRFTPNDRSQKLGSLQKGGKLEAAAIDELPHSAASQFINGEKFGIVWKEVNPEDAHQSALNQGCIKFRRLEGACFSAGVFWFDDTTARRVYRYFPSTNTLELFYESSDANDLKSPDNITITPWGDLWIAEDGSGHDRVIGLTPEGNVYPFAYNQFNDSEFAGPCFSPDGKTFFVNIQEPGMTLAIWGPFARRNAARQVVMGHAAPPAHYAPKISNNVADFAEQNGISPLAAAVLERHGVNI